jgi:hypothetical protein
MCPIVKPTRSPPGAQRPQPCCFWQKGAMSPASSCISAVNSLVTALTGWKRPVGAQNCALKALEDPANHCSCPLNSPPLSSTRATWRRGGHPTLSAPVTLARESTVIAQRGSVAISLEATFPTCQTLTSSSGGVEVWRCLHKGWLAGPAFHRFFQSPRFSRSTRSIPEQANISSDISPALLRLLGARLSGWPRWRDRQ